MKRVTFKNEEQTITYCQLNNMSLVGIERDDIKGMIISTQTGFTVLENNGEFPIDNWTSFCLIDYVKKYKLRCPKAKFYNFENSKECFKWMSE